MIDFTYWLSRFPPISWLKTSESELEKAEKNMLIYVYHRLRQIFVQIEGGKYAINTLIFSNTNAHMPLVMLHGMGTGVGMFALNYNSLSDQRPLYAMDLLGFGRSSRPRFPLDTDGIEKLYVESLEAWRKQMELSKFILMGHSLGAYLATAYAVKYPYRVRHLVVVEPWGFAERPKTTDNPDKKKVPWYIQVVSTVLASPNPLSVLRALGPWGASAIHRYRQDIVSHFDHVFHDDRVAQYLYHSNAQVPSGEQAFRRLHQKQGFGWAVNPMLPRLQQLDPSIPMTFIYGTRTWMDSRTGYNVKRLRNKSYVHISMIRDAGHHVYSHQATLFNESLNRVCSIVDYGWDLETDHPADAYSKLRSLPSTECSSSATDEEAENKNISSTEKSRLDNQLPCYRPILVPLDEKRIIKSKKA